MNGRRRAAAACWLVALWGAAGCEARVTNVGSWTDSGHYLEAESGLLSGGFDVGTDTGASGERYLVTPTGLRSEDAPGEARAVFDFTVRSPGDYKIWGRIRSPTANNNRFWVRVDDGDWIKWRISVGDIWYWDAFHKDTDYGNAIKFPLLVGKHTLTIANCADDVELDRLYYTSDLEEEPPGNDTLCNPPHSIEVGGMCQDSCGAQGGNKCGTVCKDHQPFFAYDCGPMGMCCYIAP